MLYTWSVSVPVEGAPFVISVTIERGTRSLKELTGDLRRPSFGFDGPFLEFQYFTEFLQPTDLVTPRPADKFQDQLMHLMPDYVLSEYHTGRPVEAAPSPGIAPIPLTRRPDTWSKPTRGDQQELENTYPNMDAVVGRS